MKYLRSFNENINSSEIDAICKEYNIRNYIINIDGSIDVSEDVFLFRQDLEKLPLNFRKIDGSFYCWENRLVTLEGAPQYVSGTFDCRINRLKSLEYCPRYVGRTFNCSGNKITSLEHCPKFVGEHFICSNNKLTSLEYSPIEVSAGSFECKNNMLVTLEYCPKKIGTGFYCSYNQLTSLKGLPKRINGKLKCDNNKIKNIDYLPDYYIELWIDKNPISNILKLILADNWGGSYISIKKNKELIFDFKDREIIQEDIILIDRLVEFLEDIGKPRTKEYLQNLLQNEYTIQ